MRQWSCLLIAVLFALCVLSQVSAREGFIQIKGSDTMVNLGQAWAEKYMEEHSSEFIAVTGGGSGTGISSMISGTCDIAMCSRSMKEKELLLAKKRGVEPYQIIAALDGIAVIVHPQNPVSRLTVDQLADIFTGRITNWNMLGGADLPIVLLSREVNSGTHVYFKEHILRHNDPSSTEEFAPGALLLPSSQAIADEVANNPSAIGYYGLGYISPKQKAIALAADAAGPYVEPTIDSVVNSSYPLSRPLFLYANGEPQGAVRQFVDFILSAQGQKIVIETDFVPVAKTE